MYFYYTKPVTDWNSRECLQNCVWTFSTGFLSHMNNAAVDSPLRHIHTNTEISRGWILRRISCCVLTLVFTRQLGGESPENFRSLSHGHLLSQIQPLQRMSGDYPEISACLNAAYQVFQVRSWGKLSRLQTATVDQIQLLINKFYLFKFQARCKLPTQFLNFGGEMTLYLSTACFVPNRELNHHSSNNNGGDFSPPVSSISRCSLQ